jgi:TRAP-type C4-dicarboxylate transport system permease small subunit
MKRFDQILMGISDRLVLYVCGTIVVAQVVLVCANVFSRYVLHVGGVVGAYTYTGLLLVPLVTLALTDGWYKKTYPIVDIVIVRLKSRVRWGFQLAYLVLTFVLFTFIFLVATSLETIHAYKTDLLVGAPGYFSPEWPWSAVMIIGFLFLAVRNVLDIIIMIRTKQEIPDR